MLLQLHKVEGKLQLKPLLRILQINVGNLTDTLQTIGEGTSMDVQFLGSLQHISLKCKKYFQRLEQLCIIFLIVFL